MLENKEITKIHNYIKNIQAPKFDSKKNEIELLEKILKFDEEENLKQNAKKSNNSFTFNPYIKYAFSFSLIIIVIGIGIFTFNNLFDFSNGKLALKTQNHISFQNNCTVNSIIGKAFIITNKNNRNISIFPGDKINQSDVIKTDEKSSIELAIGLDSIIKIRENSEVKIATLYKKDNIEKTSIILKNGKAFFNPKTPSSQSSFEVITDSLIITTKGTEFTVSNDSKKTVVALFHGCIGIHFNIDNSDIIYSNNMKLDIRKKIKEIAEKEIILNKNEKIEISYNNFNLLNSETKKISDSMKNINSDNKSEVSIKNFEQQINKLEGLYNELKLKKEFTNEEWKNNFNKEDFITTAISNYNQQNNLLKEKNTNYSIEKLPYMANVNFLEKNTSVAADNKYIYITNDSNIYCIDSYNGSLKWKFTHEDIKTIINPALLFKNEIIFTTQDNIFIINKLGNIKFSEKITNGKFYLSSPVQINNEMLIPSSNGIYQYNSKEISLSKNISESNGPIYISSDNTNLYCNYVNENSIKVFDLNYNKINETSNFTDKKILMPPLITDKYLLLIDISGNIYRFEKNNINQTPKVLNIGTGVLTNIINKKNNLYFIANNGWFYSFNIDNFNYVKIINVDLNPTLDKYFVKKMLLDDDKIYFCSDKGKMFYFDTLTKSVDFINIKKDNGLNFLPLVGSPVKINESIYLIDTQSNVYKLNKS